jgi:spore germination protein KC
MFVKQRVAFGAMLLILLTLLVGGCWDLVSISERTMVIGMGIDKIQDDEPILLTAQVVNFQAFKSGGGGTMTGAGGSNGKGASNGDKSSAGGSSVIVETIKGRSLSDAVYNFLKYSSRRVIFSHNRVIVLGNELARSDIAGIFDEMTRDYQFRPTNWILVAENTAREILEARTDLGTVPANEINIMMDNLTRKALIDPVNMNDFIFQLKSEGKTGLAPLVQMEQPDLNPFPRIKVEKTAVFKNNRLIGVLTTDESHDLTWLDDRQKGGSLVFIYQSGKKQQKISVEISGGTTHITPQVTQDGILMKISCSGSGVLRESEGITNNFKTVKRLEQRVEKVLETRLEQTIEKAQQMKADFLGFGRLIHADDPDLWLRIKDKWEEEFPKIRISVHFQINLARYGNIKNSVLKEL